MPYFRRAPIVDGMLPGVVASPEQLASTPIASTIVEKAAAILDQEMTAATSSAVDGPSSALAPFSLPSFSSLSSPLDFADLQKRASEALAALLNAYAQSAPMAQSEQRNPAADRRAPVATVPVFEPSAKVKAGDTAKVVVTLANDGPAAANLVLYSTDFVSDTGFQIPSAKASFSPRAIGLSARAQGASEMKIAIPAQSASGIYSALVQATGLGRPCAVVVLHIE